MIIKLYKNKKNYGRISFFRIKPTEDPDKREQDFLLGRGEFGVNYDEAFDKHLNRLKKFGNMERLWLGKAEAVGSV